MSDLISRKALVHGLMENYEQCMTFDGLLKYIHAQATAFDVDKVVERLECEKGNESDYINQDDKRLVRHWNLCIDNCRQIVKGGGKDE